MELLETMHNDSLTLVELSSPDPLIILNEFASLLSYIHVAIFIKISTKALSSIQWICNIYDHNVEAVSI